MNSFPIFIKCFDHILILFTMKHSLRVIYEGSIHQKVLKCFLLIFLTYNPFYLVSKIWNLLGDKQGTSMGFFDSMYYSLYFGICLDVFIFNNLHV